jgi:DnaJ-class molecular chaperone
MPKDYYLILGVPRDAANRRIKQAYRQLARRFHPDSAGSKADTEAFLQARRAYEVLADPRLRETHDRKLKEAEQRRRSETKVRPLPPRPTDPPVQIESLFRDLDRSRESARAVSAELVLSRIEAATGGAFILPLPVDVLCPACGDGGMLWQGPCRRCRGRGSTELMMPIRILLPPHTPDGAEFILSVDPGGAGQRFLHFRVVVQPR